jgi:hypothetical protein
LRCPNSSVSLEALSSEKLEKMRRRCKGRPGAGPRTCKVLHRLAVLPLFVGGGAALAFAVAIGCIKHNGLRGVTCVPR